MNATPANEPILESATPLDEGRALALRWSDARRHRFHAFWLRDNARDAATRSGASGQRLITLGDLPEDIRVDGIRLDGDTLRLRFLPEGRSLEYGGRWLREHAYDRGEARSRGELPPGAQSWDAGLDTDALTAGWHEVLARPEALRVWLGHVRRFGFARLVGGPVEPAALFRLVERFGYVRETHYGRLFDVRTRVDPANLAFTSLGLQPHTDNPYRDPTPTLQILYCLENSAEGGESRVVDGFRAAERLRDEDPEGFDCLAAHCARFEYREPGSVHLAARRPMIALDPDGRLAAVRFNNRSTAPISDVPYERMPRYYAAYRRFGELIEDPALGIAFTLHPGECFIVDNTRVLHGRRGYGEGGGRRWLQGCYADRDGLLSTLCVLEAERGATVATGAGA